MRFKKRHRRAVEWINTNFSTFDFDGGKYGVLPLMTTNYPGTPTPFTPAYNTTPFLVGDEPDVDQSLTEERKSYTIRRIVGDLHFSWCRSNVAGTGTANSVAPIMCKWGISVQNVAPDTSGLLAGPERQWSPFLATVSDFAEMPWMHIETNIFGANYGATWRKAAGIVNNASGLGAPSFDPTHTVQGGTGFEFPSERHYKVDIRVNRTVRRNQRMFLNVGLVGLTADATVFDWAANPHAMITYADLRVLVNWKSAFNRKG